MSESIHIWNAWSRLAGPTVVHSQNRGVVFVKGTRMRSSSSNCQEKPSSESVMGTGAGKGRAQGKSESKLCSGAGDGGGGSLILTFIQPH